MVDDTHARFVSSVRSVVRKVNMMRGCVRRQIVLFDRPLAVFLSVVDQRICGFYSSVAVQSGPKIMQSTLLQ